MPTISIDDKKSSIASKRSLMALLSHNGYCNQDFNSLLPLNQFCIIKKLFWKEIFLFTETRITII